MNVILLKVEHEQPARALVEALREAGVRATELATVGSSRTGESEVELSPQAVICEVSESANIACPKPHAKSPSKPKTHKARRATRASPSRPMQDKDERDKG